MFSCFACPLSYESAESLICHIRVLHSSLAIKKYICKFDDCIREFDKIDRFSKHLETSHKVIKPSVLVPPVSKKFKSAANSNSRNDCLQSISEDSELDSCFESEPPESFSTLDFFHAVNNSVLRTVAHLYSRDAETRSHVQEVISAMKDLMCGSFLDVLKQSVIGALQTSGSKEISSISCMFDIVKGMFDDVETEWKRLKTFREHNVYIDPVQYPVGTALLPKNVRGQVVMETVLLHGSFIPTRKILKLFLELPGVLDQILTYMTCLEKESDVMENIVQGSLWKDIIKPKFGDNLVLPLNMSFDDLETNKDLGSHTTVHKLSACHITVASLPPAFQSLLENVFLCLLFHSTDKAFGLEEVFRPLLNELKFLEEKGIEVVVNNRTIRIFFALCIISGDNLAINTILGLAESFTANYFCRMCKLHSKATKIATVENTAFIRTQAVHDRDVQRNDMTSTGVKHKCIWDELKSFKITENIYADIMHDLVGVADYDMSFIIDYMVQQKKWLSYDELNDLVQSFNYGKQELGNKPPLILPDAVKKEKLGFSASETICLVRFFPLMVGHKVKNKEDRVWNFFLSLRDLFDRLLAPTISRSSLAILKEKITEHHKKYMSLSKNDLRPKYHKLLHYLRIIEAIGPLKPLWAMRSESKYKELRQAARVTSNRIAIAFTLSVKTSLKVCERFISQKGLEHRLEFSSYCERTQVDCLDDFVNFSHKLPSSCKSSDFWNIVKWVKVDGTDYEPGMVVVESLGNFFPNLAIIDTIALTDNREVIFLLKHLVNRGFVSHLHSYLVECDESWDCWDVVYQKALVSYTPAHIRTFFDGKQYVMLRCDA